MNRMRIMGMQINRVQCEHPECLELHRIRNQAARLQRWNLVTHAERRLSLCPNQPKDPR